MTSTSFNVGMANDRSSSKTNKKNDSATSSSDSESDADYVPSTKELKDEANRSADEESDGSESPAEAADHGTGKRKKRNSARKKKKTKITDEPEETEKEADVEPPKNVDDIWNEFKKDVDSKQPQISKIKTTDQSDPIEPEPEPEKPKTKTVTELFEFAGEAVQVEKEVPVDTPPPKPVPTTSAPRRGGGMASILGQIGKKNKLSVLEKSKLDWNNFKKQEGIEEDLQVHNKGKDGFLERQDFLQRTDLRQFEIEKAMRSTSRRK